MLKPSEVVPRTFIFASFFYGASTQAHAAKRSHEQVAIGKQTHGHDCDGDEEGIEEEQEELPELSSFQDMWTESQVSESSALRVLL